MNPSSCAREHFTLKADHLAQWYLRLNGFLTINDFVLHRDERPWGQRTDADIFGVRFPNHRELEFTDDEPFVHENKTCFVIAEVTQGQCKLNGPWTDPAKENMHYVLRGIGAFESSTLDNIAAALYENFCYECADYKVELLAFGKQVSPRYANPDRPLLQFDFVRVCRFIFWRFSRYLNIKRDHQHWDFAGQELWRLAETHWNSEADFIANALSSFGIPATPEVDRF